MIFAQKCPQEASERSFRECASVAPQNTARSIGIGAAVTRRPLPHHRAYGSVHGGSIGYVSTPQTMTEVRAI
jgi:hypothetical protein